MPYEAVDVTQGLITLAKTSRFAPALAEIIEAAEQERLLREAREYEEALARRRAEQAALPEASWEPVRVDVPPKTESLKRIRDYMRRVGRPMPTR